MIPGNKRLASVNILRSPTTAVVVALTLRLLFLWLSHHYEDRAHQSFMSWGLEALLVANSLGKGHGFGSPFLPYGFPTAWLAPVYPWLLSFGPLLLHLQGHTITIFAQILNVIFSALTCYPIYFLGRRIFGIGTGLAAAWLWVFLPVAILMPIEWTWDQDLSALLLAVLLCYTYFLRESSSALQWSGYGLLWAVGALTNPTLCIVMPFLALWLWFQRRKNHMPSTSLFARFALFFVLALTPWTLRNYFEIGGLMFVKSNFGLELWLGNNPDVKDVYTRQLHPMENFREYQILVLTNEPYYNRLKERDAFAFIRANPRRYLKLCYNRFVDTWAGVYDVLLDTYIRPLHLQRIYVWYTAAFSILAFVGLALALSANALETLPLAICMLIFPIPYYITHSSIRYRHPIDPIMTILVVVACARLGALFRRQKSAPSATGVETPDHESVLV